MTREEDFWSIGGVGRTFIPMDAPQVYKLPTGIIL
jgi:hypothetical protein